MVSLPRLRSSHVGFSLLALVGCAEPTTTTDEGSSVEADIQVASAVIVAETSATEAAETLPDAIKLPVSVGGRYASLPAGTIFVGARAKHPSDSKNPEGFLRRVASVRTEGDTVVITTTPASLPDAILNGGVRTTSSGGGSYDLTASSALRQMNVDVDFSARPLLDETEVVETEAGSTSFKEMIRFDRAKVSTKPSVDVDLKITQGRLVRFLAKVEGNMDASIAARAEVTAEGPADAAAMAKLKTLPREVRQVIYDSKNLPLPTFYAGTIPVSTSVDLTVTMVCKVTFGGLLAANAGVEAHSHVSLAAVQKDGVWSPPVASDFDIRPSFSIDQGSEVDARCTLETAAQLSVYGAPEITMAVSPYVNFGVALTPVHTSATELSTSANHLTWSASAGASGTMRGKAAVFGLGDLDQTLVEWKGATPLRGLIEL